MTEHNGSSQERQPAADGRFSARRWAAVLASCLVPGAGHWIMGRYVRGLLLMALAALDVAAIVRLADAAGGRHLLLIVYLGMAIPVLYFYGVFDTLQTTGTARLDERPAGEEATADGNAADAGSEQELVKASQLQGDKSGGEAFRLLHAVLIIAAGLLLLFFLRMPDKLRPWLDEAGDFGAPALLFALTAWIVLRRRNDDRFRLGRWTSGALAFGTGALLAAGESNNGEPIALLGSWWPLLFVLLGCELLAYSIRRRNVRRAISADMSGVLAAVIVAVTAYSITQYAELPFRWLDQWAAQRSGYTNFSEEKGFSYNKPAVDVDVPAELRRIVIDNPNGTVRVERGSSKRIVVESTVWIDSSERAEADAAALGTTVELAAGEETSITTVLQGYGEAGERKPRVNVKVLLPPSIVDAVPIENHAPSGGAEQGETNDAVSGGTSDAQHAGAGTDAATDASNGTAKGTAADSAADAPLVTETASRTGNVSPSEGNHTSDASMPPQAGQDEVQTQAPEQPLIEEEEHQPLELRIQIQSGDAEVFDIAVPSVVAIEVGNGTITAQRIAGKVTAKAANGSLQLLQIDDQIEAAVTNGTINVVEAGGNVTASTANGGIQLFRVLGDAEVETKNGEVSIREVGGLVKADTLNGTIEVNSSTVGGDWDIVGLVGDVRLQLPTDGSYELSGSVTFGQIRIDSRLPLTSVRKTVRGVVGGGEHRIYVNANSSIVIAPFVQ